MTRAAVTLAFTRGAKQCQHLFFFPPTTICQLYVTWHTLACATYATLDTSMCICICHLVHITQACDAYAAYISMMATTVCFRKLNTKL